MTATVSRVASRPINFSSSAPYFCGLLLLALIAFWPTYVSRPFTADTHTHLHALTATLWMLMLVAQPLAIRTKRLTLHRRLGRSFLCVGAPCPHEHGIARPQQDAWPECRPERWDLCAALSDRVVRSCVRARNPHATDGCAARALHGVHRAHPDRSSARPDDVLDESEPDMDVSMVHVRCDGSRILSCSSGGSGMPGSDARCSPRCSEYLASRRRFYCSASIKGRGRRHSSGGLSHFP
jgi:hypothetical protein